jgi:hypothetical protein
MTVPNVPKKEIVMDWMDWMEAILQSVGFLI